MIQKELHSLSYGAISSPNAAQQGCLTTLIPCFAILIPRVDIRQAPQARLCPAGQGVLRPAINIVHSNIERHERKPVEGRRCKATNH
jgi:hypothetical protein